MTPRRLHQLKAFHTVLNTGSIGEAAEALRLSQPAVTKLLRALEEETRLELFDRSRRRLTPTAAALRLQEEVDHLFATARRTDRFINDVRLDERLKLRIAANPSIGLTFLPGLIGRFTKLAPMTKVSLTVVSSMEVHDLVNARQCDLGFALPMSPKAELSPDASIPMPWVVAMQHDHPLAPRRQLHWRDLEGHAHIYMGRQFGLGNLTSDLLETYEVSVPQAAETQNAMAACEMVMAGLGLAIVPAITAARYLGVLTFRAPAPLYASPVLIVRPQGTLREDTAQMIELFQASFKQTTAQVLDAAAA